jgi:hypothetical protein
MVLVDKIGGFFTCGNTFGHILFVYMYIKKNNNFEGNRYFSSPNVKIHW